MTDMYTAVTPDQLRTIVNEGTVPPDYGDIDPATLRASVFLAATAVGREYMPPRTAFEVMGDAMPIIRQALGVETQPL